MSYSLSEGDQSGQQPVTRASAPFTEGMRGGRALSSVIGVEGAGPACQVSDARMSENFERLTFTSGIGEIGAANSSHSTRSCCSVFYITRKIMSEGRVGIIGYESPGKLTFHR